MFDDFMRLGLPRVELIDGEAWVLLYLVGRSADKKGTSFLAARATDLLPSSVFVVIVPDEPRVTDQPPRADLKLV